MLWASPQEALTHLTPRRFLRQDRGLYDSLVQDPRTRDFGNSCFRKHSDKYKLEAREGLGASVALVSPLLQPRLAGAL